MGLKLCRLLRQTSELDRAAEQRNKRRGDGESEFADVDFVNIAEDAVDDAEGDHAAADGLADLGGGGNTGIDGGGGDGKRRFNSGDPPFFTSKIRQTRALSNSADFFQENP